MEEPGITLDSFFIPRGNSPEAFDVVEEALDDVAQRIEIFVISTLRLSVYAWGNDGLYIAYFECSKDGVGVVCTVRQASVA